MRNSNLRSESSEIPTTTPKRNSRKPLGFHLSLVALSLMVLIVSLDATALAVATPVIAHDLRGTTLEAFWASLSFLLAAVVAQPIYTAISDVFGRKIPLHSSFLWFVAGSIILATAQAMPMLIVGRVFQGIGAGGIDVLGEIILVDMTTLKERPLYLGLFSIPMAGGSILGPIIGALFSQQASWRWLGWMNLPISAFAFVLVLFFLRLKPIEQKFKEKLRRLDWIGIVLFTIGSTLFASPLSWAGAIYPWSSWKTILPLALSVMILVSLAFYERKPPEPIFPYRIFHNQTALVTLLTSFLVGAVVYSGILYMPLFFQAVELKSPLRSAVATLPMFCTSVAFSVLAGVLVEMVRRYRWVIILSWGFTTAAFGLVTLWDCDTSPAMNYGFQILLGGGFGPLMSILTLPMQASVQKVDDSGMAVGILISFRLVGGLAGLAMCSTIFNSVFRREIVSLGQILESVAILRDAREAIRFIPELRNLQGQPELVSSVIDVYRRSIVAIFYMLAGVSGLGFLTSFFIQEITMEKEELGRQHFQHAAETVTIDS
ncbi:major facilitator superfamily domain-containing protein [Clohesyomyces aquaticus]|uniref:Major facilitator superfamily domain-containing protein n=1 Tax=Clohesyomyces aquaticus TaxID=1231657 RepID=A0A1Y1ZPM9_9PLEO|nr:major facilitator superfamily domain-containing protein [Clohesyomyces aquaticus]